MSSVFIEVRCVLSDLTFQKIGTSEKGFLAVVCVPLLHMD